MFILLQLLGTIYLVQIMDMHVQRGQRRPGNTTTLLPLKFWVNITRMRCKSTSLSKSILKQRQTVCVYVELLHTLYIFLEKNMYYTVYDKSLNPESLMAILKQTTYIYTQIIYTWVSKAGSVHTELTKPTLT